MPVVDYSSETSSGKLIWAYTELGVNTSSGMSPVVAIVDYVIANDVCWFRVWPFIPVCAINISVSNLLLALPAN